MATRTETRPATEAARRPRRERDEELLVWPDLVFVEFISAVLFTITLTILSAVISGPLLDKANPDVTPNPSKAPWYFLNLQELLLHMHPALAGVVVPTIWLIMLAALPYFDRSHEGQGVWFGTLDAKRITIFSTVFASIICVALILFDGGKHVVLYEKMGGDWPSQLAWLSNMRAIQQQGLFNWGWPEWSTSIPYIPFELKLRGQSFQNLDFPAFLVEQFIPVAAMVGLPLVLLAIIKRWTGHLTKHDAMVAIFTGFISVFVVLTVVGTAMRGPGMELLPPWEIPAHPEE
jgi:menaquinol-cytochrome c reductase cytochrome b/c subunit